MEGEQNLQDLYNWVDSHALTRQKKNLNRDFSDAVPLAEILKQHFPRWVDIHNYAPKNSVAKKIDNWFTINRKVLCKLELQLTQAEMIKLAKSTPGAIEDLLQKIKSKVEEYEKEEKGKDGSMCSTDNVDGDNKYSHETMVSLEMLEKQAFELDIKTTAVRILNQKVEHLESLLEMKNNHIKDLEQKIDDYVNQENSCFLNKYMK